MVSDRADYACCLKNLGWNGKCNDQPSVRTMLGKHSPVGFMTFFNNILLCSGYISDTHRYTTEAYVQSSATISDCFVEQIIGISRIRCAILDKTLNGFACVYDGKTQVCHICLAPYIAGTIERLSPPAGLPIWMRGKMWLIDHLNCRKSSVTECKLFLTNFTTYTRYNAIDIKTSFRVARVVLLPLMSYKQYSRMTY